MNMEKEQQKTQDKSSTIDQEEIEQVSSQASASESEDELEDVSVEIRKLEAQLAEYKDRYVRSVAESENQRKRFEREKSDLVKYGNEKILSDLLPVLDSFEKAIEADTSGNAASYAEGVRMVHKQLSDVLSKHGLSAVKAAGEIFDPNMHQAIQKVEEDVEVEMVKEEYQKGYTLNDRLVRPAIVSVSVPAETKD